jgi:penicillin-binding protein 1C
MKDIFLKQYNFLMNFFKKTLSFSLVLRYWWIFLIIVVILMFWFSLPDPLFSDPTSTVLLDRNGSLLGAKISDDEQWRFPETRTVPEKFRIAVTGYEDRYFRYHPGFNPVSLLRAAWINIRAGRIISGGSTITMQVIRLSRKNHERTIQEKIIEIILAVRLEISYSKNEILALYASHAPFGSNVVGLDAAAWRYFGTSAGELSWAETVTLAVLPNSPSLIYPGKNQFRLLAKRNLLLNRLKEEGIISQAICELSMCEALPGKPLPLPQHAPHLTERAAAGGHRGKTVRSTIDLHLQDKMNRVIELHYPLLAANEIHNAAALVLDVNTGNVLAYAGNIPITGKYDHGNDVDIITSPRSTGSILKPFLYAAMLNDGLLLPNALVPDIPIQMGSFIPENYSLTYDGAVPAKRALSRSLNIPAVKMLQSYGYEQFCTLLTKTGLTSLSRPADHYGLSVILGGAEADLWDLAGIYGSMARTLNHYNQHHKYSKSDYHPPVYVSENNNKHGQFTENASWYDAASIWLMFEAMVEVSRPDEEMHWQQFSSSSMIAWKTGTSFGNRDAWSIGITPDFVVAIWAGNASGEGRPGLTGIATAAPILFDIFKILKPSGWFGQPFNDMVQVPVCHYSGYRASSNCENLDTVWIQKTGLRTAACPFHRLVHLDNSRKWQVSSNCESPYNMITEKWFVLPPLQEWYFKNKNPFYKVLPPFRADCLSYTETHSMDMIYPRNNSRLFISVDIDGNPGNAVFKVAHRNPGIAIYWHLDDRFIGTTIQYHQMALAPAHGFHRLTLIDEKGESLSVKFEIINKKKK